MTIGSFNPSQYLPNCLLEMSANDTANCVLGAAVLMLAATDAKIRNVAGNIVSSVISFTSSPQLPCVIAIYAALNSDSTPSLDSSKQYLAFTGTCGLLDAIGNLIQGKFSEAKGGALTAALSGLATLGVTALEAKLSK